MITKFLIIVASLVTSVKASYPIVQGISIEETIVNKAAIKSANLSLSNLSCDIEQYIFSFLDFKSVLKFSCVNKKYRIIGDLEYVWQALVIKDFHYHEKLFKNGSLHNSKNLYKRIYNSKSIPIFNLIYEEDIDNINLPFKKENTVLPHFLNISGNGLTVLSIVADKIHNHQKIYFLWNTLDQKKNYIKYDESLSDIVVNKLNYDGSICIGRANVDKSRTVAFAHNIITSETKLLNASNEFQSTNAVAISKNNNIIICYKTESRPYPEDHAVVWNLQDNNFFFLENLSINVVHSTPRAITLDNKIIVGTSLDDNNILNNVIWTEPNYKISKIDHSHNKMSIRAVSDYGEVIVGSMPNAQNSNRPQFAVWNRLNGVINTISHTQYNAESYVKAMDGHGKTVIGELTYDGKTEPFIWRETFGMLSVRKLLKHLFGYNTCFKQLEFNIYNVTDIDSSGHIIVGHASFDGLLFAYRTVLPLNLDQMQLDHVKL